jgi:L-asparaginase II
LVDELKDVLLAEVSRSRFVECRHYGSAVVVDPSGEVCFSLGQPEAQNFGRSANKMMQAVALLRAGLVVTDHQLALTTASHSGSAEHLAVVQSILHESKLSVTQLKNVEGSPLGRREYDLFVANREKPSTLTMNCSGKHASMLATCVQCGWDLETYLEKAHPLQQRITEVIAEFTHETTEGIGVDGCGAPAHRVSLVGLARSLTTMVAAASATPEGRVMTTIRMYPVLVGGLGRDVTEFLLAAPGWVGKDGADGGMVLASPDGFSVAVRVIDGAERPRIPVALAAIEAAGVPLPSLPDSIRRPVVLGGGRAVGRLSALKLQGVQGAG